MLDAHGFKNSLFFTEHVSYVTQAASKCKKMQGPVGIELCGTEEGRERLM